MAICDTCKKEMLTVDGCIEMPFQINEELPPIRYGDETRYGADWRSSLPENKRCHDCNCKKGQFHHPGCDMEECPNCHRQAIGCDCVPADKEAHQ
jgi:hypothetical protein